MKLALYQCAAGALPARARLAEIETQLAQGPCDLLVCPELFLSGYVPDAAARAEPQGGPFGRAVAALAARSGTAIAYGYPERAEGQVYNAVALYDARGALMANHRKRLPSPGSFEETAFAPGPPGVTLAELGGWRVATIICYEVEFPEIVRAAVRAGADLVIVPTALGEGWGIVSDHVLPARAYESGVWIGYASHCGAAAGLRFHGGSRIVGPDGQTRAVAGTAPARLATELDRESVARMRARLPFLRDSAGL